MARFKFRLEAMLKLRHHRQQEKERVVGERTRDMLEVQNRLTQIDRQINQQYTTVRQSCQSQAINIDELVGNRVYLNHLHAAKMTRSRELAAAQTRVEQAKRDLAEAKKQTDIMEKLKEHARERFNKEQAKRETVLLDDMTSAKYAWKHRTDTEDAVA